MTKMDLRTQIISTAEQIKPFLKPLPGRPERNAYAHVYGVIKTLCKVPYNLADPQKVLAILKALEAEPNGSLKVVFDRARIFYRQSTEIIVDS